MNNKIFSLLFVSTLVLGACSGNNTGTEDQEETTDDEVVLEDTDNESDEVVEEEPEVPKEHKSALKKAENYTERMNMSKARIYEQLVSEDGDDFSEEAAQYAIDNIEVDWGKNALAKAENYAEEMEMSDSAIYDQLVSEHGEQFTEEEAQYAIDNME